MESFTILMCRMEWEIVLHQVSRGRDNFYSGLMSPARGVGLFFRRPFAQEPFSTPYEDRP